MKTDPKKILLCYMSKSIPPMFSSPSFIVSVSGLTFWSLIQFEFTFVCGLVNVLITFF